MKTLTELELEKAAMLKAVRTAVRLKHALAADRELNEVLPKIENAINLAIASGEPFELTVGKLFDEA